MDLDKARNNYVSYKGFVKSLEGFKLSSESAKLLKEGVFRISGRDDNGLPI